MYPNLLFFHPDLARGTVMYRAAGLPWAKKWARETGRVGARYPWQTESSGKVASRSNEIEIHIVGDVALSMWQYFAATANTTWLRDHGACGHFDTIFGLDSNASCALRCPTSPPVAPCRARCEVLVPVSIAC